MRRLLLIDGGGSRGILAAHLARLIEERAQARLAGLVDIIGGAGTGAILATALALGFSAKTGEEFYAQEGDRIFKPRFVNSILRGHPLRNLFRDRFNPSGLDLALRGLFELRSFASCKPQAVVSTCQRGSGFELLDSSEIGPAVLARDVVTAACQVMFGSDAGAQSSPSLVAVSSLKKYCGDEFRVISIGTGQEYNPRTTRWLGEGLLGNALRIVPMLAAGYLNNGERIYAMASGGSVIRLQPKLCYFSPARDDGSSSAFRSLLMSADQYWRSLKLAELDVFFCRGHRAD